MNTILLLDVATSGFDPKKDVLLELALLLFSADPGLEVLESVHHVIQHDTYLAYSEGGTPDVKLPEFHLHNGLAAACADGTPIRKVEAALLAGPWATATRLVGRNPDFERKFLAEHMPTFARGLPAAKLDLNEVEWFATTIGGVPQLGRPARTYRAEDDVVEAYEALRYYSQPQGN